MPGDGPTPETLGELLTWARNVLAGSTPTAALDAEVLLMHCIGRERAYLRAWPERLLNQGQADRFLDLVNRRRAGWPVAYLTGEREFWARPFRVAPGVLIPRPETELLIELALDLLPVDAGRDILDLGTGSGILAITLAAERPTAHVTAIETSSVAIGVARDNARRLNAQQVRFIQGDWFTPLAPTERYDLILSNPPYIAEADPHLGQGDLRFEPPGALASGPDGLDALRAIIIDARQHLKPSGVLLLEHGWDQAGKLARLLAAHGYCDISQHADLQGHPRATMARCG